MWSRLDLLIYTPAEFEQMLADENPLIAAAVAEVGLREGFLACFVCQQAGEKALKALCYLRGDRVVLGHSLVELLASVADREAVVPEIREGAQQLDQYYVPTRYPNALPGGVPAEVFTRRQAEEAVAIARRIVAFARAAIGP